MKLDDVRSELAESDAEELLRHAPLLRLAYVGRDELPRVIPTGFLWDGGRVVVCTATTSPKVRAISERPNVALAIEDATADKSLQIRGVAAIEVVDGVPSEYLTASRKTMDGNEAVEFERRVRSTYEKMARISIDPQWARLYNFSAGRLPAFLRRLVDDR